MTWVRAVRAEWTKVCTLPSTGWLALGAVAGIVLVSVGSVAAVNVEHCPSPTECFEDTPRLSLTGVAIGQAIVVVLAVLPVTSEYSSRTITATLAAVPRRRVVLLAKTLVAGGLTLAVAVAGVLGGLLAGRLILPGNGFTAANGYPPLSLGDGPTLRAYAGSAIYLLLVGLLSMGLGLALRDSAGAITAALGLLFVVPTLASVITNEDLRLWMERLSPMTAGLAIQRTVGVDTLPIAPWTGIGVMAGWAAAAVLLGLATFRFRDA